MSVGQTATPHALILASAGTGKTYALTTRMAGLLLQQHVPVRRMLATTFTRNAAGEIAERLVARLAGAYLDQAENHKLADALASKEPLPRSELARALLHLRDELPRLQIATLDSVFMDLASVFAWKLDLPANWRIGDERHLAQIEAGVLESVLAEADDETLDALHGDHATREILGAVGRTVGDLRELLSRLVDPGRQGIWESLIAPVVPPSEAEIDEAREALENASLPLTKVGKPDKRFSNAVQRAVTQLQQQDWAKLADGKFIAEGRFPGTEFSGQPYTDELHTAIVQVADVCYRALAEAHLRRTTGVRRLLETFQARYREAIRRSGLLGFRDVTEFLSGQTDLDLLDMAFRLDAQFDHVLLDEFQDTSVGQWDVLHPLLEDILATADGSKSAFIVGDVKQAIYRWRGGAHELFDVIAGRYAGNLGIGELRKSFRSAQVVLDFVNTVFTQVGSIDTNSAALQQTAAHWAATFPQHETAFPERQGCVVVQSMPPVDDDAPDDSDTPDTFAMVPEQVRLLREADPARSIGILVRANKSIPPLLECLALSGSHVALVDASVGAIAQLADHPDDGCADTVLRHSRLLAPLAALCGYETPPERLAFSAALRRLLVRRGFAPVLLDLRRALGPVLRSDEADRFAELLLAAQELDNAGWQRPGELNALLQYRRRRGVREGGLQIMSIHQSKGLQFDAVILPDLDTPLVSRSSPITLDETFDVGGVRIDGATLRPSGALRNVADVALQEAVITDDARDMHEAFCMLYVALTRARSGVVVFLRDQARSNTFAHVLRHGLGLGNKDPVDVCLGNPAWGSPAEKIPKAEAGHTGPDLPVVPTPLPKRPPRLTRQQPSGLARGDARPAAEWLATGNAPAFEFGHRVHGLLEGLDWLDDDGRWQAEMARLDDAPSQFLLRALENDVVATWLRQATYAAHPDWQGLGLKVRQEHRFAVRREQAVLTGAVDRLVLGYDSQGHVVRADILDFKTDRITAEQVQEKRDHYQPQMQAYREAVAAQFRLDESKISGRLLFLHVGAVVDVY